MQDEHWVEAKKMLIKEAFALFDKDKKGATKLLIVQQRCMVHRQDGYFRL